MKKQSGKDVLGADMFEKVLDIFTFYYKVTNLVNYATYEVRVMGYTAAGNGPCPNLFAGEYHCKGFYSPITYIQYFINGKYYQCRI